MLPQLYRDAVRYKDMTVQDFLLLSDLKVDSPWLLTFLEYKEMYEVWEAFKEDGYFLTYILKQLGDYRVNYDEVGRILHDIYLIGTENSTYSTIDEIMSNPFKGVPDVQLT